MSILIIEESSASRLRIERVLRSAGHADMVHAASLREALELLRLQVASEAGTSVDAILMDTSAPESRVVASVRELKADSRLRDIPVVVLTDNESPAYLEEVFAAGALDFIPRPVEPMELRARVGAVLRLKEEMDARKAKERELLGMTRQLQDANRRLEEISNMDGLTGVANRRHFDQCLEREWRRSMREVTPLGLLLIDVDHFKAYNDTLGHLAGDLCLQYLAEAVERHIRRPADLLARYGGEEFVVLLPDTDEQGALAVAETLRQAVLDMRLGHPASPVADVVTVSIGVCAGTVPDPASEDDAPPPATTIVEIADQALYEAKNKGRNRVESQLLQSNDSAS